MPRTARLDAESRIHHVYNRGVGKQLIFEDDLDRGFFISRLRDFLTEEGVECLAWCLMGNHYHLLLRGDLEAISMTMHRLQGTYAGYFNRVHGRTGSLFEGRFSSRPVEADDYLLAVVRYIHDNPVKAGLVSRPEQYRWSSFREYIGKPVLASPELVVSMLGGKESFEAFHWLPYDAAEFLGEDDGTASGLGKGSVSEDDAKRILMEVSGKDRYGILCWDRRSRDGAIAEIRRRGVSVRQLQRLTGLSRGVISRARPC